MKTLFLISLSLIIYTYFLYPIIIYLLSNFYKKRTIGKYIYPTVSILVSAYNEEKNINSKLRSLLALDYPEERLEILIGSDGSTDSTNEIVNRFINANPKFKLYLYNKGKREGKPSMLNLLVSKANNEILVFSDCRQRLDVKAVKEIVKYFEDSKVGSVSGELHYESNDANKTAAGLGLYWKYEKFIRKSESRMGSMLGATGALYAIRKPLFPQLPADLILDDVYVPLKIVEKGYRAVFDKRAKVYDKVFEQTDKEFLRKARTLAGNYQLFYYLRSLFNPFKGKISWQFFSHKFLRLTVPFLLIIVLVSNIFIVKTSYFYAIFFLLQVVFYGLAILGRFAKIENKVLDVPLMFCVMNAAAVVGLYRFLHNKQSVTWEKAYHSS